MDVLLLNEIEFIVTKEEIAHYEEVLIRHNVFKSHLLQRRYKAYNLLHIPPSPSPTVLKADESDNITDKRLTLSHMETLSDASTVNNFLKILWHKEK